MKIKEKCDCEGYNLVKWVIKAEDRREYDFIRTLIVRVRDGRRVNFEELYSVLENQEGDYS